MGYIFILQLEQGKYYIGKTNNPQFCIESDFNLQESDWTIKYKPIELIKLIPNCDVYDEDKYTRIYIDKYGIQNVCGGSFVQNELDPSTITHLDPISYAINNKCFISSKEDHFAKVCDENECCEENECYETESDCSGSVWICEYCDREFIDPENCKNHEKNCRYYLNKKYIRKSK